MTTREKVLERALDLACKYITIMEHDWERKKKFPHRKLDQKQRFIRMAEKEGA